MSLNGFFSRGTTINRVHLSFSFLFVWISYSVHVLERLLLVPSADPSLCTLVPGTSSVESGEKTKKLCLPHYPVSLTTPKQECGYTFIPWVLSD